MPDPTDPPPPPPAKRLKLDLGPAQTEEAVLSRSPPTEHEAAAVNPQTETGTETEAVSQVALERAVGITEYVDAGIRGWSGILKQRYTDFLVNEIDEEGNVMHLTKLTVDGQPVGKEKEKKKQNPAPAAPPAPHIPEPTSTTTAAVVAASRAAKAAEAAAFELSADDFTALSALITPEIAASCVALYRAILSAPTPVELPTTTLTTPAIPTKDARSTLHALVRRLFSSKLETTTLTGDCENQITIKPSTASSRNPRQHRGNRGGARQKAPATKAADRGGDYCHFLLYKENKDTMHAVKIVQKLLGLRNGGGAQIGFAGTKDKRAVTVQRCSVYRVDAARLARLNGNGEGEGGAGALHAGTRVGNFEYKTHGLELGDLGGNEFVITLRECAVAAGETRPLREVVEEVVDRVRAGGFVNYFGLQRFGSYSVGTWEVGVKLLAGDWCGAVGQILHYDAALLPDSDSEDTSSSNNPNNNNRDDIARAAAIAAFNSKDYAKAANLIPYKYSAESAILHYFAARPASTDYCAALGTIPRALKTMYVHALQSYVWNHVASARVRMGMQVLPGDLVLIPQDDGGDAATTTTTEDMEVEVDQDGEVVVHAPTTTTGPHGRRRAAGQFQRARALSAAEACSGRWGVRDIVLPTPGWDVVYPQSEALLGVYKDVMAPHGLDPLQMRRGVKEFSLPGSYRGVVAGFLGGRCGVEVVRGCRGVEQVVATDLEVLVAAGVGKGGGGADDAAAAAATDATDATTTATAGDGEEKIAVVLRMCLGTSTYATMALREFMREGIRAYKPEFSR
ncbi:putative pseudouridine synthase TruD/Pus7 [Morchella snyderi]|nr:putative pseudouridine synthase TruD/Pus7 [Morchella snyderi]